MKRTRKPPIPRNRVWSKEEQTFIFHTRPNRNGKVRVIQPPSFFRHYQPITLTEGSDGKLRPID